MRSQGRVFVLAVVCAGVLALMAPGTVGAKPVKDPGLPGGAPRAWTLRVPLPDGPAPRTAAISHLADAWTTLFSDGFESGFPGQWTVLNQGASSQQWGVWTCWSGDTPTHSAGCAAGGAAAIGCGDDYPNDMEVWLVAGPFDLSDTEYTAAELNYNVQLASESDYDVFAVGASTNGVNFTVVTYSGSLAPQAATLDLAAVPTQTEPVNFLGESQVWIAFVFASDGSVGFPNGAQIDDVVLRVAKPVTNEAPQVTVMSPNGGETWQAGSTHAITYTATDADGGPSALSLAFAYSVNGGSTWTAIAGDQTNTGAYTWIVPAVASTDARVRATASDGLAEISDISDASFTINQTAPGDNTLTLGDASGEVGNSVVVPLGLTNSATVKGVQCDIMYDAAVAALDGVTALGRAAGMAAASQVIAPGQARVVLYHDGASTVAAGTGIIANLVFTLIGAEAAQTGLAPVDIIVSDPDGQAIACDGVGGTLTATAATGPPELDIVALRNPGRVHTLEIIVAVAGGSGGLPVVLADEIPVTMTSIGANRYVGTFHSDSAAASVTIRAVDTNGNGQGSNQITVAF